MKNKELIAVLSFGLLLIYYSCNKDDSLLKETQQINEEQILPSIKSVSLNEAGPIFDRLKTNYKLDKHMQMQFAIGKSTIDTLGVTIYTDDIREVTIGDYASYTMLMKFPEQDSTKIYNITMEEKNGIDGMFVTEYKPTQQWLQDKSTAFEGGISTRRVDDITAIEQDSGGSGAINDTANDYSYSGPSLEYPWDCQGDIIITYQMVTLCNCLDHLPGYCAPGGCYLGTRDVSLPHYSCVVNTNENYGNYDGADNSQGNTAGNNSNGTTNPPDNENQSTGVMVGENGLCLLAEASKPYDLNNDCVLSPYEECLKDGNPQSVCVCVESGGELEECQEEIPCPGDPVPDPLIAPQYGSSGVKGALHGCTRYGGGCTSPDGRTKFHNGLDIKNEFGNPIYALYDGEIISNYNQVGKAGYVTRIRSELPSGEIIIYQYFHMQQDGRLDVGTEVIAGQVVGYQGDSGNLKVAIRKGKVDSHVHIKMNLYDGSGDSYNYSANFKNNPVNPADYIHTEIDEEGISNTTNCN